MEQFQERERFFNNADSFAMAFDKAWERSFKNGSNESKMSAHERLDFILKEIQEHPFFQSDPKKAKEVGEFRIRLLKLT